MYQLVRAHDDSTVPYITEAYEVNSFERQTSTKPTV
jgi:hypothetical protein